MMYVCAFGWAAWVYGCEARVHIGGSFNERDTALEGSGARTLRFEHAHTQIAYPRDRHNMLCALHRPLYAYGHPHTRRLSSFA